jgi:hypothetical protein
VLPFFEMVSDALSHAHERGVIHRDLKPQNLMTTKGAARILDFGVGALLDPRGERFTRVSAQVGGDAFSAPETVEQPGSADPRSDVYSLGACWYWLLTGAAPRGLNLQEKLRASVKLDQSYEGVLMKCLDQVEGRYQSASDLAADIRRLRGGKAPSASGFEPSDDEARLMGVAVGGCPNAIDRVSFYQLEQELRGRMSRLRASLALKALLRREFLDVAERREEHDGSPYLAYAPTHEGAAWTAQNVKRIEMLDPSPSLFVDIGGPDDIPFLRAAEVAPRRLPSGNHRGTTPLCFGSPPCSDTSTRPATCPAISPSLRQKQSPNRSLFASLVSCRAGTAPRAIACRSLFRPGQRRAGETRRPTPPSAVDC